MSVPGNGPGAVSLGDGRSLAYDAYGSGPVVMLLHGSPGTARAWQRVAERLAPRFRVIAPNLPGYGGSTPVPPAERAGNAYAAGAIAALAAEVGAPLVLAGHSYGGVVALQATLHATVRPGALALFEPVAVPVLGALGDAEAHAGAKTVFGDYVARVEAGDAAAVRTMVEYWFGPGAYEQMPAPMRAVLVEQAGNNARDVAATFRDSYTLQGLRGLAMPVLLVLGDRSPGLMAKICEGIAATVPQGSLVRLAKANHALTTTHADAVADLIAGLADRGVGPGGTTTARA